MPLSPPARKAVVLVVEDDPLLRMQAIDVVEDAGCEAIEAVNADEAIEILTKRPDIRIVFTDIQMSGSMDGLKLAAVIRNRWPPVEIIVTSGHLLEEGMELPERSVFFAKPYRERDVTETIRRWVS